MLHEKLLNKTVKFKLNKSYYMIHIKLKCLIAFVIKIKLKRNYFEHDIYIWYFVSVYNMQMNVKMCILLRLLQPVPM